MKGFQHLIISFFILVIFASLFIFLGFNPLSSLSFGVILITLFFFVLGSILPDSDSNDKKSLIFVLFRRKNKKHLRNSEDDWEKPGEFILISLGILFYPFAWVTNQLEKIILKFTSFRERGHKKTLHTIFGILIVSGFWSIIIYLVYLSLANINFNIGVPLVWFISLFISQFLHLLEDLLAEKQSWKIIWR